jgi:hypothetical protein
VFIGAIRERLILCAMDRPYLQLMVRTCGQRPNVMKYYPQAINVALGDLKDPYEEGIVLLTNCDSTHIVNYIYTYITNFVFSLKTSR